MTELETITRADVLTAYDRIRPRIRRTPVMRIDLEGSPVVLKLELLQHTGSFKARGAFNRILSEPHIPPSGVVTASGGNHGLAVAYVANQLGIPAEVFVAEVTPEVKRRRIADLGATVRVVGRMYQDALEASRLRARETGALEIHAYDHRETVAGQGTMALEIEEQVEDLATVVIAVGGGGLAAGAAAWFMDDIRLNTVEPETSRALDAALANNKPVDVEVSGHAADSLGAKKVGEVPWSVFAQHRPTPLLVSDDQIRGAQRWLWDRLRLIAEPGGATALAAALSGHMHLPDVGNTVIVVCGANADPRSITRL